MPSATGGVAGTGGIEATSGVVATGGAVATGGVVDTGGVVATGGVEDTGGGILTGGDRATGGITGTGGTMSTGGTTATGGTMITGGVTPTGGSVATGGIPATGGIAVDAGSTVPDAGVSTCSSTGKLDEDICWYYGTAGANCTQTCASRGGMAKKVPSHIGTAAQGGSLNRCKQVLALLGMTVTVQSGTRNDRKGLGCHMFPNGGTPVYYWLSSPNFSETASMSEARLICGCVR